MPRGDRTGPQGMGPRTGRAAGYCAGYETPGYANSIPGGGYGRGMAWRRGGGGRGWGRGAGGGGGYGWQAPSAPAFAPEAPTQAPIEERSFLEQQMAGIKAQLDYLGERLKTLAPAAEAEEQE